MSRFKTDHLVLPDTAAAVAASLNSVPAGAQDFLLPPTVAAALAEAEAKQLLALEQGSAAAAAQPQQQAQQAQQAAPQDASGAANAFLSSLSDMLGGPSEAAAPDGGAEPAPPLPAEPPPEEAAPAAEAERPVDLFKAIFEDSEEEDEEEVGARAPRVHTGEAWGATRLGHLRSGTFVALPGARQLHPLVVLLHARPKL